MAKGGRKQKQKRKDFQKVKLKAGKVKPKADNFTNTTFKSQAIQIKEQLKDRDESQPTNQRKQNINDLMCHLNHYNSSIRHSSVLSIKDLLASHPVLLTQNLSSLVNNLVVLLTDKDDNVRKAGVTVLQQVMQSVSATQISPFFAILNAHICCAMTHITEAIQVDSLAVLDCILQNYAELVVPHSKDLLTNFVHQISQQKKVVQGKKDMLGAELSVNPSSTMSSQKWRIKVLQRLQQFLQVLVTVEKTPEVLQDNLGILEVNVGPIQRVNHVQMYGQTGKIPCLQEGFVLRSSGQETKKTPSISSSSSSSSYSPEELFNFITSLVPLLMQCWAEVSPQQHSHGGKMNPNAWETLDGVLKVLQLLWRWMDQTEHEFVFKLQKRYLKTFNQQLLQHFPYCATNASPGRGKKSANATSVSMVTINLAACDVMSYFINASNVNDAWVKKVMSFVMETLAGEGCSLATEHVQNLLFVAGRLVKVIPDQGMVQELIEAMCILYEKCHLRSKNKRLVLNHLAQLTVLQHSQDNKDILGCAATSQWLSSLPLFLLQVKDYGIDSTSTALDNLLQALSRQHPAALTALQDDIRALIDSSNGILLQAPPHIQRKVVELLHHVKQVDVDLLKELAVCCHDNRMHVESVTYLLHILTIWVSSQKSPCPSFYSFLFSVNLGYSKSALDALQLPKDSERHNSCIRLIQQPNDLLLRHKPLNQTVCMCYGVLGNKEYIWTILQTAMLNILTTYHAIPYTAAYAILHTCTTQGAPPNHWREDFTNKLTDCCLAVLAMTVGSCSIAPDETNWEEALWSMTVNVVSQRPELWGTFCCKYCSIVPDIDSLDELESVATVITRLIQTEVTRLCILGNREQLQKTVEAILTHPMMTLLETRWLAEFKYETELVLHQLDR